MPMQRALLSHWSKSTTTRIEVAFPDRRGAPMLRPRREAVALEAPDEVLDESDRLAVPGGHPEHRLLDDEKGRDAREQHRTDDGRVFGLIELVAREHRAERL